MQKYIELHCHFDGSLDVKTSYKLAKERNLIEDDKTLKEFRKDLIVPKNNKDLYGFLSHFEICYRLLQDKEAIYESYLALVKNLKKDNVVYAEIRFAPQLHLRKGLTQEEVLKTVIKAKEDAFNMYGVKTNLILCMMISDTYKKNYKENKKTVELAHKYLNKGVVCVDLAGGEDIVKICEYKELFDLCKSYKVPFIIHAGEHGSAKNVDVAIKMGAKRIGHGGHALEDKKVIDKLVKKNILLEQCVSSNVQCKNQPSYKEHSLKKLMKYNVKVSINTDNRTLSNTTITKEIKLVKKYMGISDKQIKKTMIDALENSFLSKKEKEEYLKVLNKE